MNQQHIQNISSVQQGYSINRQSDHQQLIIASPKSFQRTQDVEQNNQKEKQDKFQEIICPLSQNKQKQSFAKESINKMQKVDQMKQIARLRQKIIYLKATISERINSETLIKEFVDIEGILDLLSQNTNSQKYKNEANQIKMAQLKKKMKQFQIEIKIQKEKKKQRQQQFKTLANNYDTMEQISNTYKAKHSQLDCICRQLLGFSKQKIESNMNITQKQKQISFISNIQYKFTMLTKQIHEDQCSEKQRQSSIAQSSMIGKSVSSIRHKKQDKDSSVRNTRSLLYKTQKDQRQSSQYILTGLDKSLSQTEDITNSQYKQFIQDYSYLKRTQ